MNKRKYQEEDGDDVFFDANENNTFYHELGSLILPKKQKRDQALTINNLPDELLIEIAKYAREPEMLSVVSKRFRNIVYDSDDYLETVYKNYQKRAKQENDYYKGLQDEKTVLSLLLEDKNMTKEKVIYVGLKEGFDNVLNKLIQHKSTSYHNVVEPNKKKAINYLVMNVLAAPVEEQLKQHPEIVRDAVIAAETQYDLPKSKVLEGLDNVTKILKNPDKVEEIIGGLILKSFDIANTLWTIFAVIVVLSIIGLFLFLFYMKMTDTDTYANLPKSDFVGPLLPQAFYSDRHYSKISSYLNDFSAEQQGYPSVAQSTSAWTNFLLKRIPDLESGFVQVGKSTIYGVAYQGIGYLLGSILGTALVYIIPKTANITAAASQYSRNVMMQHDILKPQHMDAEEIRNNVDKIMNIYRNYLVKTGLNRKTHLVKILNNLNIKYTEQQLNSSLSELENDDMEIETDGYPSIIGGYMRMRRRKSSKNIKKKKSSKRRSYRRKSKRRSSSKRRKSRK